MAHRLEPLLGPRSIAVVGASRRKGTVGNSVVRNLLAGGFQGPLYAVNPGCADVEGVPCFSSLGAVPGKADQVIFAISDGRLESALDEAIAHGARSAVIYSSLILDEDGDPPLRERIRRKVRDSGLLLCGANGMGYYNFSGRTWACGFETRAHRPSGNVTLISQSGSGMSGILDVEERIDFNLAVSTGQELSVTLEDYLEYAIVQPETRVIGLFLETSREPARFIAALERAAERRIPVVVVKVGRTEFSSRMAQSHTGALTGSDRVYDAVFRRHGVQRVADMDELATTLIMFAQPHAVAAGGVAAIHDSGGERQLLIDLAEKHEVPLTSLAPATVTQLEAILDPGLPAVNPLDAWSRGGPEYHQVMEQCFTTLLGDPQAALGAVIHARGPHGKVYPAYVEYMRKAHAATGKPVFLVAARQGPGTDPLALEATREGFPVLDGVASFLAGARGLIAYRDFLDSSRGRGVVKRAAGRNDWRARLAAGSMNEAAAMEFLSEHGIPCVESTHLANESELVAGLGGWTFPVVLKTATPGIAHKSDAGGVILNLRGEAELLGAYRKLAARLGPAVTVAPMVTGPAVEMILGMHTDEQFGPVVVMGMGGIHAELLADTVTVLPPFDEIEALRLLDGLRLRKMLDGARGAPRVDTAAYCRAAAAFSNLAVEFAGAIREIDLNPVLVLESGCRAVDALIIPDTPASPPLVRQRFG